MCSPNVISACYENSLQCKQPGCLSPSEFVLICQDHSAQFCSDFQRELVIFLKQGHSMFSAEIIHIKRGTLLCVTEHKAEKELRAQYHPKNVWIASLNLKHKKLILPWYMWQIDKVALSVKMSRPITTLQIMTLKFAFLQRVFFKIQSSKQYVLSFCYLSLLILCGIMGDGAC